MFLWALQYASYDGHMYVFMLDIYSEEDCSSQCHAYVHLRIFPSGCLYFHQKLLRVLRSLCQYFFPIKNFKTFWDVWKVMCEKMCGFNLTFLWWLIGCFGLFDANLLWSVCLGLLLAFQLFFLPFLNVLRLFWEVCFT